MNPKPISDLAHQPKDVHQGVNNHLDDGYFGDIDTQPGQMRKKEKPVHRLMAFMAANGYNHKEISEATGQTTASVSNVLRQPFMRALMQATQRDMEGDFRKEVVEKGQAAFARVVELSESARSEAVKADLDKYLINRYLGMPSQPIEQIGKPAADMTDDELKMAVGDLLRNVPLVSGERSEPLTHEENQEESGNEAHDKDHVNPLN